MKKRHKKKKLKKIMKKSDAFLNTLTEQDKIYLNNAIRKGANAFKKQTQTLCRMFEKINKNNTVSILTEKWRAIYNAKNS